MHDTTDEGFAEHAAAAAAAKAAATTKSMAGSGSVPKRSLHLYETWAAHSPRNNKSRTSASTTRKRAQDSFVDKLLEPLVQRLEQAMTPEMCMHLAERLLADVSPEMLKGSMERLDLLLRRDFIGNLPLELSTRILSYLPVSDIEHNISLVSRKWLVVARTPSLWRTLFHNRGWNVDPVRMRAYSAWTRAGMTDLDSAALRRAVASGNPLIPSPVYDPTPLPTFSTGCWHCQDWTMPECLPALSGSTAGYSDATDCSYSSRSSSPSSSPELSPEQSPVSSPFISAGAPPTSQQIFSQQTMIVDPNVVSFDPRVRIPRKAAPQIDLPPLPPLPPGIPHDNSLLPSQTYSSSPPERIDFTPSAFCPPDSMLAINTSWYSKMNKNRPWNTMPPMHQKNDIYRYGGGGGECSNKTHHGIVENGFDLLCNMNNTRQMAQTDWRQLFMNHYKMNENWREGRCRIDRWEGAHSESIYCLQFDKHNRLFTGSRDHTVKVWYLADETSEITHVGTLRGHVGSVLTLQVDGKTLITGSSDSTACVWDLETGRVIHTLNHHDSVLSLRFNDEWLVTSSKDRVIRVWSRKENYKLKFRLFGHRVAINAVQLKGDILVSASGDRTIKVWNITTQRCLLTFTDHTRGVACLDFDGKYIVSGSSDRSIRIWNIESGKCEHTIYNAHEDLVRTIMFDREMDLIVSASYDESINIWRFSNGALLHKIKSVHTSRIFKLMFDRSRIVSCSHDRSVSIIDFAAGISHPRLFC